MEDITKTEVDIEYYNEDERAAIDIQIATAKHYPRDIKLATKDSIDTATLSKDVSKTCIYAIPRSKKRISGPSVHLARIIAQNWTNIRVESKVSKITDRQIISHAICFDLQKNYAVKIEVRKSIIGQYGRFNDDMITVTGNAANAVAYRNAVFAVIPSAVIGEVHNAVKNNITGDLSTPELLEAGRNQITGYFEKKYGVTVPQIVQSLGLKSVNQIKQDEIIILAGLNQAIKDGDTTIKETFGWTETPAQKKARIKKANSDAKSTNQKPTMP